MTSIFLDIRLSLVSFESQKMLGKKKIKQMRKIIFLSLDNMENSKGKNVEEKINLLAYSTSIFFLVRLIRVLRLIICILQFFFFLVIPVFL